MERESKLEHLWDFGMPKERKRGLLKMKNKRMSKNEQYDTLRRDNRKDSSLRKPNEVPGSASKNRSHRQ